MKFKSEKICNKPIGEKYEKNSKNSNGYVYDGSGWAG